MPYTTDWKDTVSENPTFKCRGCSSTNVYYREWESSDGAHEDLEYKCYNCNRSWWVEGSDY